MLQDSLDCEAKTCGPYLHLDKQSKSSDMKKGGCLRVWVWLQTGKTSPTVVARQWRCVCRVCSGLRKRRYERGLVVKSTATGPVFTSTRDPIMLPFYAPLQLHSSWLSDPSVRVDQLGSIRTDIHEVLYWGFLLESVVVIYLWLESEKMRGILYEYLLIYIWLLASAMFP